MKIRYYILGCVFMMAFATHAQEYADPMGSDVNLLQ